jgi:serine/threonine-protein kinase
MWQQGRLTDALAEFRQAVAQTHSDTHLAWLAYAQAKLGHTHEARALLRELTKHAQREQVSPTTLARVYLGLGDYEQALAALRQAYEGRSDHILRINIDPVYDPLRQDPRFLEMARGMGLQP